MLNSRIMKVALAAITICFLAASVASATDLRSRYIRQTNNTNAVIVFVHGVIGDGTSTWTNSSAKSYWPDLISQDKAFSNQDIYVYEYSTPAMQESFSIDEIADSMRLQFDSDEVSAHREIIFVAHSMGGLAVRAYLLKYREVANRVRFIYFYSTPTTGSEVASLIALLSSNPQFGKMRPMSSADYTADLQRQWLAAKFPIPSYCAYEKRKTFGVAVVGQASAASLCTQRLDPIDANHIDIVKPSNVRDASYLAFKSAFAETSQPSKSRQDDVNAPLTLQSVDVRDFAPSQIGKYSFPISRWDQDYNYSLFVHVEAQFGSAAFNKWSYLSGFGDIEVPKIPKGARAEANLDPASKYDTSFPNISSAATDVPRASTIGFAIVIKMKERPKSSDTFELRTGPRKWTIQLGELDWIKNQASNDYEKNVWWGAKAKLTLRAADPDWIVLYNARALPIKNDNKTDERETFIEVTIENRSSTPFPLNNLMLSAFQRKHFACDGPSRIPPPEQISIDWPRIVKKGPIESSGSEVLVTMSDSVISAQASFQPASCSNDTRFSTSIPVRLDLSPGEMGRILLRMKEFTLNARDVFGGKLPTSLARWDQVYVSLSPSEFVYPAKISLYSN